MDTILSRHRNIVILVGALLLQFLLLAIQIKRPTEHGSVRLIRVITIRTITPFEKAIVHTTSWFGDTWRSYFYLRGLRNENDRLEEENARLRMEQVRMVQDASQAQRLQALLRFKEQFINDTVAAQVIGASGTEQSRLLYIDKGSDDGIKPEMAVITPAGVVGKVVRVQSGTAQILEINDQSSGVGAILEKSRLQGILKGEPAGDPMLRYIMADEKVEVGEQVLTSGGDRIFPKGLPVGTVVSVDPGKDLFLNIRVKPWARLNRVEEVLVITKISEKQPDVLPVGPQRAADILAARLPTVTVKPPDPNATQPGATNAQTQGQGSQPQAQQAQSGAKPQGTQSQAQQVPTGTKLQGQGTTSVPKPQGTAINGVKPQGTTTTPTAPRAVANGTGGGANGQPVKRVTDLPSGDTNVKQSKPTPKPDGVAQ